MPPLRCHCLSPPCPPVPASAFRPCQVLREEGSRRTPPRAEVVGGLGLGRPGAGRLSVVVAVVVVWLGSCVIRRGLQCSAGLHSLILQVPAGHLCVKRRHLGGTVRFVARRNSMDQAARCNSMDQLAASEVANTGRTGWQHSSVGSRSRQAGRDV